MQSLIVKLYNDVSIKDMKAAGNFNKKLLPPKGFDTTFDVRLKGTLGPLIIVGPYGTK